MFGLTDRTDLSRLDIRPPTPPVSAAARLMHAHHELKAFVWGLADIGDYPGKEIDFDQLNSVVANMEVKLDFLEGKKKNTDVIGSLTAEKVALAEQVTKGNDSCLLLTAENKDLAKTLDR